MTQELDDKTATSIKDLQDQLEQMRIENNRFQKHMNDSIGFSAKLSANQYLYPAQRVPFDDVISNFGGHYSIDTYGFTCPVHGVYTFSMSINQYDNDIIQGAIYRNNREVIRCLADNEGGYDSSSATVIVEGEAGDEVYVRVVGFDGKFDGNTSPCHFSGFLLHHL